MLVSDGALDYLGTTPRSSGRCRWRWPLLALYYAVLGVAVASLTGRRIVAGATILGLTLVTSAVAGILVETDGGRRRSRRGGPQPARPCPLLRARPGLPRPPRPDDSGAGGRRRRRRRSPCAAYLVVLVVSVGGAAAAATGRWSVSDPHRRLAAPRRARGSTPRSWPTPRSRSTTCRCGSARRWRCPSWRAPSAPASPACSGPTAPARRTLMRAVTGLLPASTGTGAGGGRRPPHRPARSSAHLALVPEDEAVPARCSPPASWCATWPTCTACADRPAADRGLAHGRPARRGRPAAGRVQQGHAPAGQGGRRPGHRPAGAGARRAAQRRRPGAAGEPHRPVPPPGRRGPHGDRQLPRAPRGRAAGRPGDRARPRPAGRRRRPPGHPRRHGRPAPPGAGPRRRAPRAWPPPCSGIDTVAGVERRRRPAGRRHRAGRRPGRRRCPAWPATLGVRLREVRPLDDSLESLFRELVR